MATNFPSSQDSFTNPTASDTLDSPDHASQHADVNDAVEALQAKVGVDSSAVTTSHDYKIAQLEGKSPTITLAGDATGSVTLTNLGSGTLTVTVADDSHNHTIANVDNLQTTLDGKLPLSGGTLTGSLTLGGDLNYGNNAIIASNASSTNIDHIWHDDGANAWNFCSDTTYKAAGNSAIVAGSFSGNGSGLSSVNAATLGGLGLSPGSSAPSGSQVIRSHTNGYTYLGWINTPSGATTSTISRIYASQDNFVRYVTPATFRSQIIDGNTISPSIVGVNNGTASAPTVRFSGDTNTGIYRVTTDQIGFTTGGALRGRFYSGGMLMGGASTGNAQIGTGTGSASVPVYHFYGDTDTGIYRNTTNQMALTSGGSAGLVVASGTVITGNIVTNTLTGYKYVVRNSTYGTYFYYSSSEKYKEQINTVTGSGAIIDALRPVTFIPKFLPRDPTPDDQDDEFDPTVETDAQRIMREADLQYGFIAEEVAQVADGKLAQYDWTDDGQLEPSGWKWPDIIAVLTAEVQSLRARVATLEAA